MKGWVLIFRSATPILRLRFCNAAPSPYLQAMTAPDRTVAFRIDKPAPDRAEAATRLWLRGGLDNRDSLTTLLPHRH